MEPLTIRGEVVRCKGCKKVLYEGETYFEYPAITSLGFATGMNFVYCSRECAIENALVFCSGCGKQFREGDQVCVRVKQRIGDEDRVIQTFDLYCNECKT